MLPLELRGGTPGGERGLRSRHCQKEGERTDSTGPFTKTRKKAIKKLKKVVRKKKKSPGRNESGTSEKFELGSNVAKERLCIERRSGHGNKNEEEKLLPEKCLDLGRPG